MRHFIKEISIDNLTNEMYTKYEQDGCEFKWKEDSVEVWYIEVKDLANV